MVAKKLGEGTFGIVELAELADGRKVAIKRLKADWDEHQVAMFQAEKRVLSSLQHGHVVEVDESWSDIECANSRDPHVAGSQTSYAMEYLSGESLSSLLMKQMASGGRNLYSYHDALRWSVQLANVMAYLHSSGIIYRDMSAGNVILTSRETAEADIKLIDFGLHKCLQPHSDSFKMLNRSGSGRPTLDSANLDDLESISDMPHGKGLSQSLPDKYNHCCNKLSKVVFLTAETGSYMYMSPEMISHQPYDERTDVFALGCLIYELFARQLRSVALFTHGTDPSLLTGFALKVATGFRPSMPRHFPRPLVQLIDDCWAQDPAHRPSAAQVEERLLAMQSNGCLDVMTPKSLFSKMKLYKKAAQPSK